MKYRREWSPGDAAHVVAAAVSLLMLGAGVLHLSAAADHRNLPVMMAGFTVVAIAQVAVAALLFVRGPSLGLLGVALLLTMGSLATWFLSRTIGLPFLSGGHMEPIGFKDGVVVLFELATVPALLMLASPALRHLSLPARLGQQALTGVAVGIVLLFVPAMLLGGGGHHSSEQMAAMAGHAHDGSGAAADGGHGGDGDHEDGADHEEGSHEHGSGQTLAGGPVNGAPGSERNGRHGEAGHHEGSDGSHAGEHPESHGTGTASHEGHGNHAASTGGDPGPSQGGHGGHRDHQDGSHASGSGGHDGHDDGGHAEEGHEGHDEQGDRGEGSDHGEHGGGHGGQGDDAGGGHGGEADRSGPPVPGVATRRAAYIEPKPAGTKETIKLQYGPYVVPPGGDANQVNLEFFAADGFIVGAKPDVRYADGTSLTHADRLHVHHAHLFRKDLGADDTSDTRRGLEWVFGTGGETTSGSIEKMSDAGGDRHRQWGIQLARAEPMLMVWMPMNMSEQTQTVFLEFEFQFVHGTAAELKKATGKTYRPLSPVMMGSTFNVPKTGGIYDWPLDARTAKGDALTRSQFDPNSFGSSEPTEKGNVVRGVGEIWTAPADGMLIGGAGHQHAGGRGVVVSALGSRSRPCAEDGDRFPGTTVLNSKTYYPQGVWPAHPLMGISQPGWRVYVEKGDRLAINGVFDSRRYAWPDQMSILGFYWDKGAKVSEAQRCRAHLADEPDATQAEAVASLPDQDSPRGDDGSHLFHTGNEPCVADGCNDHHAPPAPRGPHTSTITIEDFTFTPGDLTRRSTVSGSTGDSHGAAPVVERGDKLRFVNLDFAGKAGTRHAITSCSGPCNGPDVMSYPNSDGVFYSGPLGYTPLAESASATNKPAPAWELDTSTLEPGYHTYYCWSHPWMRAAFYVEDMTGVEDDGPPGSGTPEAGLPSLQPPADRSLPELWADGSEPAGPAPAGEGAVTVPDGISLPSWDAME